VGAFEAGEARWIERLGNLRNVIRQEVIARQLGDHADAGTSVLDVGCGQGTQALRLAARGCTVTGVDPSPELLGICAAEATSAGLEIELCRGDLDGLDGLLDGRRFGLVCAHGVLMYLDDRLGALRALAARMTSDGKLSVTVRNAHGLAMRPALRRDWPGALAAFGSHAYINELGVSARADRLEDLEADLAAVGLEMTGWYGVRIFNDAVPTSMGLPPEEELSVLLEAETRAGATDPYRWLAAQLHVMARRKAA
jgi:S-adenosylmethionine-dependent methyltransferase